MPLLKPALQSASKKRQIVDSLLSQIRDQVLPPGSRFPSAATLAAEWNVSYMTMHAALTELAREGWLVRSPKYGSFVANPAEKAALLPSKAATVVLPPRQDIVGSGMGSEVFEMLQGLTEESRHQEWQIRIEPLPTHPSEAELDSAVEAVGPSLGAIFIGTQYRPLIRRLSESGVLVVSLGQDPGCGHVVTYDRAAAVDAAISHLIARGHRKIGYFGDTKDPLGKFTAYLKVLKREGMAHRTERVCHCLVISEAGAAIHQFLDTRPDCDAIFVANYRIAAALVRACQERGIRIPGEIAVMALGIDEPQINEMPLSYIKIPYLEFGIEGARLFSSRIGKLARQKRRIVTLPTQLVLRESC